MKKLPPSILSVLILLSLILSACTPAAPKATDVVKPSEPTAVPTVAPEVEISYHAVGQPQNDTQLISDAMTKMLKAKGLNVKFNLIYHDWGTWGDQMKLTYSSGEACDIVFTAPWANYTGYASDGVFLELDELLPKYAPTLWSSLSPQVWDNARVKGKIYASINIGSFTNNSGPIFNKEMFDKTGVDPKSIKEWEDFTPVLQGIKDQGFIPTGTLAGVNQATSYGFDFVLANFPAVVRFDDKSLKVVNWLEQPEFAKSIQLMNDWWKAGYTTKDAYPDENEPRALVKAGKMGALWLGHSTKPGIVPAEWKPMFAREGVAFVMNKPPFSSTQNVLQNLNAICKSSKNPTTAVQVLELMNTDVEVFNLLTNGIEGKHWVWVDKAKKLIGPGPDQANWSPGWGWEVGNQTLGYYTDPAMAADDVWKMILDDNASAPKSVLMGFSFDPDPVKTEIAAVSAIVGEYGEVNAGHLAPDEFLTEMVTRMKAAGMDKVMQEMQKQIDAWAAAK
jgi:putative aldouronate transport system substrate-binding protein